MPISAIALMGIKDNGLAWKAKLKIGSVIPKDCPSLSDAEALRAGKIIHRWLKRLEPLVRVSTKSDIDFDSFEFEFCQTAQDLVLALTDLHDWADYERVLIC